MSGSAERWYQPDLHLPTTELQQYANPRNPPLEERRLNSIRNDLDGGFRRPVQLNTDGLHAQLDDGHHRLHIALQYGWAVVPVSLFPVPSWYFDDDPEAVPVSVVLARHLQAKQLRAGTER